MSNYTIKDLWPDGEQETKTMYEVDPKIYTLTVQDFLEILDDAETHGMSIHYVGGKLYYSYNF